MLGVAFALIGELLTGHGPLTQVGSGAVPTWQVTPFSCGLCLPATAGRLPTQPVLTQHVSPCRLPPPPLFQLGYDFHESILDVEGE